MRSAMCAASQLSGRGMLALYLHVNHDDDDDDGMPTQILLSARQTMT